jgi:hypothetical protein
MLIRELQAQAKAAGKKTFKTGKPCKRCGTDEKYTCCNGCRRCQLDRAKNLDSEYIRVKNKKHYAKYHEKINARKKEYKAENRERIRKKNKEYRDKQRKQNPHTWATAGGWRGARGRNLESIPDDLTYSEIIKLTYPFYFVARRWKEETGQKLNVDHIMPLEDGGMHHPDNLQVLTIPEHKAKTQAERKARELKRIIK